MNDFSGPKPTTHHQQRLNLQSTSTASTTGSSDSSTPLLSSGQNNLKFNHTVDRNPELQQSSESDITTSNFENLDASSHPGGDHSENVSNPQDVEFAKQQEAMFNNLKSATKRDSLIVKDAEDNSFEADEISTPWYSHREGESNLRRNLLNIGHSYFRQTISVGISTFARKPIIIALKNAFSKLSPTACRFISMGGIAYPLTLNVAGLIGDRMAEQKMRDIVFTFCNDIWNEKSLAAQLNRSQQVEAAEQDILELNPDLETISDEVKLELIAYQETIITIFKEQNDLTKGFNTIYKALYSDAERNDNTSAALEGKLQDLNEVLKEYWWPTTSSTVCRVFFICVLILTAVGADQRNLLSDPGLAATLLGVIIYCKMREGFQAVAELFDGIDKFYLGMTILAGISYIFIQFANSTLTELFATPGANATLGETLLASAIGAFFNTNAEVFDIMGLAWLMAWFSDRLLTLETKFSIPSVNSLIKTLIGTHASRTALFVADVLFVNFVISFYDIPTGVAATLLAMAHSAPEGSFLGGLYSFFLGLATRADWPYTSYAQTFGKVIR